MFPSHLNIRKGGRAQSFSGRAPEHRVPSGLGFYEKMPENGTWPPFESASEPTKASPAVGAVEQVVPIVMASGDAPAVSVAAVIPALQV